MFVAPESCEALAVRSSKFSASALLGRQGCGSILVGLLTAAYSNRQFTPCEASTVVSNTTHFLVVSIRFSSKLGVVWKSPKSMMPEVSFGQLASGEPQSITQRTETSNAPSYILTKAQICGCLQAAIWLSPNRNLWPNAQRQISSMQRVRAWSAYK